MTHKPFDIISTEIPTVFNESCDWIEVQYKMCDEFAKAVKDGQVQIILSDNPFNIEIDSDTEAAQNTRALAESVYGHDAHYDWESNVLTVYMNDTALADAFRNFPSDDLKTATSLLLKRQPL